MALRKKSHPKFNVPNYGAKSRKRVQARWRKQRGIDNKKRIKKSFMGAEPTIGYANPMELRGVRADGAVAVVVHNVDELQGAIRSAENGGRKTDVTLASALSRKKRAASATVARQHGIRVTNG